MVAVAEIVGVSTRFTVSVDVAAMEREGADEYGRGWTVASLLALVGDLLERGYGPVLYRELMAMRELPRETLEQAQGRLGPHAALIHAGLTSEGNTVARTPDPNAPPFGPVYPVRD